MKKLLFSLFLLIFIIPQSTTFALSSPRNLYKSGRYTVSSISGDFTPAEYRLEIVSKESICNICILDRTNTLRFYKRYSYEDSLTPTTTFSIGELIEGDTVIIEGNGEMYISISNR